MREHEPPAGSRRRRATSGTVRVGRRTTSRRGRRTRRRTTRRRAGRARRSRTRGTRTPHRGEHPGACVTELRARLVEPDGARAVGRERDRPLRGTAPVLEHVEARDVAEHAELGLGDAPHAPRRGSARRGRRRARPGSRRRRRPRTRGCAARGASWSSTAPRHGRAVMRRAGARGRRWRCSAAMPRRSRARGRSRGTRRSRATDRGASPRARSRRPCSRCRPPR